MKKRYVIGLAAAVIVAGSTYGIGSVASTAQDCGYDTTTGYFRNSNGSVTAFGSMKDAEKCAALGILPDVVKARLGVAGNAAAKAEGEKIKSLDANVKAAKAAAKAKAEAEARAKAEAAAKAKAEAEARAKAKAEAEAKAAAEAEAAKKAAALLLLKAAEEAKTAQPNK